MRIKLDENLPGALVSALSALGHQADTVPQEGLTRKNRERLRPFDDPQAVEALLGLPARLRTVRSSRTSSMERGSARV